MRSTRCRIMFEIKTKDAFDAFAVAGVVIETDGAVGCSEIFLHVLLVGEEFLVR